jgi:outer membrane lipoprotein-sorting protein
MKPADNVKRLFKNAELRVHLDTDEQVFKDVLQAHQKKTVTSAQGLCSYALMLLCSIWRITMKSPLTKLAVAAVVIIACLIGLSLWRTSGSGIALADVVAQIEKVKSVRSQWSYKITGGDPNKPNNDEMRFTWLTSQEYGLKYRREALDPNGEWSQLSESYRLPQKKTEIVIYPTEKIYICQELEDSEVEQIQQDNRDPLMILKEILQTKYESLGKSTMDGVEVAGFRITDPNHFITLGENQQVDYKIWVDVKTLLPVRYDILASAEVDKMGDRLTHHVVIHDFQWDVPVDASEFEPPISDGYTVKEIKLPPSNEETAIQGLKVWVELLDKYPEKISDVTPQLALKSKTPAALRLQEEIKGLTEGETIIKLADFLVPIRGVARFYVLLVHDKKDPAYYGKTVTPKDADKVLMRWKVSDNEYRVIFGDLHAETVTTEKLAELEKALPK